MTAGPARVISARAAKLAIRWKSMPMAGKRSLLTDFNTGYESSSRSPWHQLVLCDGLSQLLR